LKLVDAQEDIYGGLDPREVPRYTVGEAAHHLRLPVSTLHQWVRGRSFIATNGRRKTVGPVIHLARGSRPGSDLLTFLNLVEAYVLAGIRRVYYVPLQKVRKAVAYLRQEMDVERPLIDEDFFTDGADLFVERVGALIQVSREGQAAMREILEKSLTRIERDPKGLLLALYPWAHKPDEPKAVEIDPRRAFGKLVISGTGIPTAEVAARMSVGESVDELADDYRLPRDRIEAALRWELRPEG
jgi:uncharacterized protein (DUF433 family)